MILCLETSTAVCSVALVDNSNVIALRESLDGQNHAEKITIFIDEVMKEANISYNELEAIAVSKGPGSYTGLRIGVSTAKGLCYAMEKPLIAIDTLAAMTEGFLDNNFDNNTNIMSSSLSLSSSLSSSSSSSLSSSLPSSSIFCPMIDARRMEVYSAFFTGDMKKISDTEALIIDESSFSDLKLNHHLYLFGDGADKLVSLFENEENITVIEKFHCSAAYMARLAEEAFKNNNFVDTAYFEPFYLKDFVPGIPKVKGL